MTRFANLGAVVAALMLAPLSGEVRTVPAGATGAGVELAKWQWHRKPPPPRPHGPPCAKAMRTGCWVPGALDSATSVAALAAPSASHAL
jgi:hypothetical protein